MRAWIRQAALGVALGALGACGERDEQGVADGSAGSAQRHDTSGASGTSGGSGAAAGIGGAGGGAAAIAEGCRARCAAAEPEASESPDCENGSIDECTESCRAALDDSDEPCARCKLGALQWLPASGGCGEWECVCWHGYAELPGEHDEPCVAACESTLERRARTRQSRPVPASVGRTPDAVVELPELGWLGAIAIDAEDRAWVTGSSEERPIVLSRLDLDELTLGAAIEPEAGEWGRRAVTGFALAPDGEALLAIDTGEDSRVLRYAVDGALRWSTSLPPLLHSTHVSSLGLTPLGDALVTYYGRGEVVLVGADGAVVWSGDVLAGLTIDATQGAIVVDAQSRWHVAGVLNRTSLGGEGVLFGLDDTGSRDEPNLTEAFRATFVGNQGEGSVRSAVIHGDGSIAVHGRLREDRDNGIAQLIYSPPFVARLSADGEERWRFAHDDLVPGEVTAVAFDAAGNLYAVGHEDPITYTTPPETEQTLCTVYGCDGLTVRKWSPSGELLWQYAHREATSSASALALDDSGRVFVVGHLRRDETHALVLRFDPD